jgi:hypothetical protein
VGVGYLVIGIIGLNVLVNFSIVMVEGIKNLYQCFKKLKAWLKIRY